MAKIGDKLLSFIGLEPTDEEEMKKNMRIRI